MKKLPFEKQSKETWLRQVNAELNDDSNYDSLLYSLEKDLVFQPFYHPDDQILRSGGYASKSDNSWQIIDSCSTATLEEDFKAALKYDIPFVKIEVGTRKDVALISSLIANFPSLRLHLTLKDSTLIDALPDIKQIAGVRFSQYDQHLRNHLIDWNRTRQHSTSVIYLELQGDQAPTVQLTQMLLGLVDWFEVADRDEVSNGVIINVEIGTNYLLEIAKLRAVKLLAYNFWNAYDLEAENLPSIQGNIWDHSIRDPEISLIALTSRAVSAVIGGVEFMSIDPPQTSNEHVYRRAVRSLHHILKLEGLLDKVADPLAGSYQIEKMTQLIATKSWHSFQKTRGGQGASGNNK